MMVLKLAVKNLAGAGIRTWLNVAVLSISFVAIIFLQGLYNGMNEQASRALVDTFYGGGQYWHKNYDPYDALTLDDAHAPLPQALKSMIDTGRAVPILISQAAAFPNGRMVSLQLKGIPARETFLAIPSAALQDDSGEIPALIGTRTAKKLKLNEGDYLTVRWRDRSGAFDAVDVKIVHIMKTTVPQVDVGTVWLPLDRLAQMLDLPDEATLVVIRPSAPVPGEFEGWSFKSLDELLSDLRQVVKQKSASASILYLLLMFLGLLAIFDTQVLSIFRRQKEIGTLIALGMTRSQVIGLFTLEGALHGVLAALMGALWGFPIMATMARKGWKLPGYSDDFGLAIGERLYPLYSAALIIGTTLLVLISVTIVSWLPTRRIARMNPTDALRGRRK
ncbi:MAG: FtsX-like permease family protein [candidate division KSB1 bacterium]|nr:FtsX-like permease family protein [candidate division KSB1 bacterium]